MNGVALQTFVRLQKKVKAVITWRGSRRGNFLCDSRPWLCVSCVRLRHRIMFGRIPNFILLATNHGKYIHTTSDTTVQRLPSNVVLTPMLSPAKHITVVDKKGMVHDLRPLRSLTLDG